MSGLRKSNLLKKKHNQDIREASRVFDRRSAPFIPHRLKGWDTRSEDV